MEKQSPPSSEISPRAWRVSSNGGGTKVFQTVGTPSIFSPRTTTGCAPDKPDRKPAGGIMVSDADKNNTSPEEAIDRPTAEGKPTITLDDCPLEKLKLMLVPSMDDDRRASPGRVGSGSVVTAVSPASVIDEGPFSFSERDVTKSRVSPIQRLLQLTGGKGSSLRFFLDEGSGGGGGGVQIGSPRAAV